MKVSIPCNHCERDFTSEAYLHSHVLFEHQFLMPVCSTGISEKIFHDNVELLKSYKQYKANLSKYKTQLKKKFLKSIYGKKFNMKDLNQDNVFIVNLNNYHSNMFTRLVYVDHIKYDKCYKTCMNLLNKIESKGLIIT